MTEKKTNLSFDNRRGQNSNDHSKTPNMYVTNDASVVLDPNHTMGWIVNYLIKTGNFSMFFGDPGTEKTFSMLSLAVCVALGKPWLDYETKRRKVLIVDEDGEKRSVRFVKEAIRGELGVGGEAIPIKYVSLAGFNLDEMKGKDELLSQIKTSDAGLVIVLAERMNGGENSIKDTHIVLTALGRIAEETGVEMILIHHSNQNGVYRGSSVIMGTLDLGIKIEGKDNGNWADEVKDKVKPLSKSQSYVIQYLSKKGDSPLSDIMGATDNYSDYAVKQAVSALVNMGNVYRTNPDKTGPGVKAVYSLTQEYCMANPEGVGSLEVFFDERVFPLSQS